MLVALLAPSMAAKCVRAFEWALLFFLLISGCFLAARFGLWKAELLALVRVGRVRVLVAAVLVFVL